MRSNTCEDCSHATSINNWFNQGGYIYLWFNTLCLLTQQTRDVQPMLVQCWASVEDDGPTLYQHWLNVSCLLVRYMYSTNVVLMLHGRVTECSQHWLIVSSTEDWFWGEGGGGGCDPWTIVRNYTHLPPQPSRSVIIYICDIQSCDWTKSKLFWNISGFNTYLIISAKTI